MAGSKWKASSGTPMIAFTWLMASAGKGVPCASRRVHQLGRGEADVRAHDDERGSTGLGDGGPSRGLEHVEVVRLLADVLDVPAVGGESLRGVVAQGELGRTVDRDVVVVVEDRQAVEPEESGERGGLVADALFEAAVPGDHPGAVIDQFLAVVAAQNPLGEGHADPVGDALAEGAGRDLDGRRAAALRVTGRAGVGLAERHEVLDGEVVAEHVGERVLQECTRDRSS